MHCQPVLFGALATLALALAQPTVSEADLVQFYARVDPSMSQKRVEGKVDAICVHYLDDGTDDGAQRLLDGLSKKYAADAALSGAIPVLLTGAAAASERPASQHGSCPCVASRN